MLVGNQEVYLGGLGEFLVHPVVLFALLLILAVIFLQLFPHSVNVVLLHQLVLVRRWRDKFKVKHLLQTQSWAAQNQTTSVKDTQ